MQRKELNPALPYPKWKPWPVGHPFNWHTSLGLNQLKSAFWTKYRLSKSDQRTGKVEEEDTSWYIYLSSEGYLICSKHFNNIRKKSFKMEGKGLYLPKSHCASHFADYTMALQISKNHCRSQAYFLQKDVFFPTIHFSICLVILLSGSQNSLFIV